MLTIGLLIVVILIVCLTGYSLIMTSNRLVGDSDLMFLFPLVGLAFIVVFTQNLVYLDIPINSSAWITFVLILAIILWVFITKKWKDSFGFYNNKNYIVFIVSLIILLIHGLGYLIIGAKNYVGFGWIDQQNYTLITQFLMDYPFSTSYDGLNHTPSLLKAISLKDDRIGQSIFQGFIAVITNQNAKTAYGAVSLLSPFLSVFSLWLVSRKLNISYKNSLYFVIIGATMPAIAFIHLQDFLSHSMIIPFLFAWPVIILKVLEKPSIPILLIAGLVLSAANSIYTEFTPIFIAILFGMVVWNQIFKKIVLRTNINFLFVMIFAAIFNIGYVEKTIILLKRVTIPNILTNIYPYAYKLEGITRLWFPFDSFKFGNLLGLIITISLIIITICGLSGIMFYFFSKRNELGLSLIILLLIPLVIISQKDPFPYQFYKLLCTVSPFLALGLIYIKDYNEQNDIQPDLTSYYRTQKVFSYLITVSIGILMFVTISGTTYASFKSSQKLSLLSLTQNQKAITLFDELEKSKGKNYIISSDNNYITAWLIYHARYNNVWLLPTFFGDIDLKNERNNIKTFPFYNYSEINTGDIKIIELNTYKSVKISDLNLSGKITAMIENINGTEGEEGKEFTWLGKNLELTIWSTLKETKNVFLTFKVIPGPSTKDQVRKIRIGSDSIGWKEYQFSTETKILFPFDIKSGLNKIQFETTFPDYIDNPLPGDPRVLYGRISEMEIKSSN